MREAASHRPVATSGPYLVLRCTDLLDLVYSILDDDLVEDGMHKLIYVDTKKKDFVENKMFFTLQFILENASSISLI